MGKQLNVEVGRAWKEAVVIYFKTPSQHLAGRTDQNPVVSISDPVRESNSGFPECKAGVLRT
jgi:hypothetical protein